MLTMHPAGKYHVGLHLCKHRCTVLPTVETMFANRNRVLYAKTTLSLHLATIACKTFTWPWTHSEHIFLFPHISIYITQFPQMTSRTTFETNQVDLNLTIIIFSRYWDNFTGWNIFIAIALHMELNCYLSVDTWMFSCFQHQCEGNKS